MPFQSHMARISIIVVLAVLMVGCSSRSDIGIDPVDPPNTSTNNPTATESPTPYQPSTNTPFMIPPSNTPTSTDTPTATFTPVPTDTPIPSPTQGLVWNPGGEVTAPILLYHHVSDDGNGNRYYVTTETFRAQMQALRNWGYTSITVTDLVDVLINGGELPSRPVVITFDDGNLDVYQYAFPIMHEMGFVGTTYIVANRLQSKYFVDVEQLQEMADDGWEIGSHSMTHSDLTTDYSIAHFEMRDSMLTLEDATGEPISSFAYPYGRTDDFVSTKVSEYGYSSGMGLGSGYHHYLSTLFYLSRMEVQGEYDMEKFASMLPWSGN